ncbi:MAG: transglycosylase SLT domain-containing protein [Anaerolineae bacterium]|nr:transglycosylase SLT domain-containing protein [Anaerolineae bacterium]
MPCARNSYTINRQTAASTTGSGCSSGFIIPPLAVLLVGLGMAFFVHGLNIPVQAEGLPSNTHSEETTNQNAALGSTGLSPIFTPEIQTWSNFIIRWAAAASLDPNLVAVVMQIESCGDPRAISRAGAMGLFQVMPYHFDVGENPYQPDTNALRGLGYLKRSQNTAAGNARLTLAGYNGGIGVINRGEWSWAAETVRYVRFGFPIYEDARAGKTSSASLNEWYRSYGAGLCRAAAQRLGLSP